MVKRSGLGIIGAVLGAVIGFIYAKEVGAILGFVIGLLLARSFER